ncbi:hypothetical protein ABGN05_29720, partial [Aquibium sp. LZ166]
SENGQKHAGMAPIRSGCRKTRAQSGSRGIDRPNHPVVAGVQLKLVKRQMYGRGKIDLLQARVIGAQ